MKKVLNKLLLTLVMLLVGQAASAATTFTLDGLTYTVLTGGTTVSVKAPSSQYTELINVVIPETVTYDGVTYTVTELAGGAFIEHDMLTSVQLPATITKIGDQAFQSCKSLTSIDLPDAITYFGVQTFRGCSSLSSIHIPASLTTIDGTSTFRECAFESFEWPATVTQIPQNAFEDCKNLKSITIPEGTTYISNYAFQGCTGLTEVELPATLQTLQVHAFDNCTNLKSVKFKDAPDAPALSIYPRAFNNTALKTFEVPGRTTGMTADGFANVTLDRLTYLSGAEWPSTSFSPKQFVPVELVLDRNIDDYFFTTPVTHLERLTLGEHVTKLNANSFKIIGDNGKYLTMGHVTAPYLEPFALVAGTFSDEQFANTTLWIPGRTKDAYLEKGWKFANVEYTSFFVEIDANHGGALKLTAADVPDQKATDGHHVTYGRIPRGTSVTFDVTEKLQDWDFTSLTINGNAVSPTDGKYTVGSLVEELNASAAFTEKPKFDVSVSITSREGLGTGGSVSVVAGGGITLSADGRSAKVYRDRDVTLSIVPATGYEIVSIILGDEDLISQLSPEGTLTFTNLQESKSVKVTAQKINLNVTLRTTAGGTLKAADKTATKGADQIVVLRNGSDITVTAEAETDYDFTNLKKDADVVLTAISDGASLRGGSYTQSVVKDEPVYTATFTEKPVYNISVSSNKGGTLAIVTTDGLTLAADGKSATTHRDRDVIFDVHADKHYVIESLLVNGEEPSADNYNAETGRLTYSSIASNYDVQVQFKRVTNSLFMQVSHHGKVTISYDSPSTGQFTETVENTDSEKEFIVPVDVRPIILDITPDADYGIGSIILNGSPQQAKAKIADSNYPGETHYRISFTEKPKYDVTVSTNIAEAGTVSILEGEGISVADDGQSALAHRNRNVVVSITPNEAYIIASVMVNGVDRKDDLVEGLLTLEDILQAQTIVVNYAERPYNTLTLNLLLEQRDYFKVYLNGVEYTDRPASNNNTLKVYKDVPEIELVFVVKDDCYMSSYNDYNGGGLTAQEGTVKFTYPNTGTIYRVAARFRLKGDANTDNNVDTKDIKLIVGKVLSGTDSVYEQEYDANVDHKNSIGDVVRAIKTMLDHCE